ncbi:MAG: NTP transferase domain-containing protein [Clostridia bacterium]|nr:NTP transferase domain-containing protein [Clostridia bacterium]
MKALILNSGLGTRMGVLTREHPKCMTDISPRESILSRQLALLEEAGVEEAVITTGLFDRVLREYAGGLERKPRLTFVKNPRYAETNYIASIDYASGALSGDILLLHGDLVFEPAVLELVLRTGGSLMTVSKSAPLPEKDFKAVIEDGRIRKVGVEFFENAVAAQPLYRLTEGDLGIWLRRIREFVARGDDRCYAEKALNEVSGMMDLRPLDVGDMLLGEVDDRNDLAAVTRKLAALEGRTL